MTSSDPRSHPKTPGPPVAVPGQVREFARKFNPYSFLEQIAFVSAQEHERNSIGRMFPRTLNSFGLSDLARYVLQYGDPKRRRHAKLGDVLEGVNLVNGLLGLAAGHDSQDAFQFLYRTAVKQFPDQYSGTQRLGRTIVLFNDLPREVPRLTTYPLHRRFEEITGITVEQFIYTAWTLWAATAQHGVFTIDYVARHQIPGLTEMVDERTVRSTLSLVSTTRAAFVARAETEFQDLEDDLRERFAFNPLMQTPVVRIPGTEERYVAPVPTLLLRRLVEAPYYVLADVDKGVFAQYFGEVFEEYVGWLLRPCLGDRLRGEFDYGSQRARKRSPDWLVEEGDSVALLECKTRRLPKEVKTIASHETSRDRFAQIYGQASHQLAQFVDSVAVDNDLRWLAGRRLEPFVVPLDRIYLANSPAWDDGRERAASLFALKPGFRPTVLDLEGLELLASTLAKQSLSGLAQLKLNLAVPDPPRNWDWQDFARSQGGVPNAMLDARWDHFIESRFPG